MALRTSREWWSEIRRDPDRLLGWLVRQYHGEVTAAARIERYCLRRSPPPGAARILEVIASQERAHAAWIGGLLAARGVAPAVLTGPERYWEETLPGISSFEAAAAVAAHAEAMRLERIRVIAEDPEAPADIRGVFRRILRDEEFHARAFGEMAGAAALASAREAHERGKAAIGFLSAEEALS
jgi:rubrerythrin